MIPGLKRAVAARPRRPGRLNHNATRAISHKREALTWIPAGRKKHDMNMVAAQPVLSGITCLTAIARFHGLDYTEAQLVQLAAPGPEGVKPPHLVQVARKIDLTAKLIRLSWDRLHRLGQALPAILILRDGEAVILSGVRETADAAEIVVRDPRAPEQGFLFW